MTKGDESQNVKKAALGGKVISLVRSNADRDRIAEIALRWDERAARYPLQVRNNSLQMMPIKEFTDDMVFLINQVLSQLSELAPVDAERVSNLDIKWQEFEMNARRDMDAGRRVPIGIGKLIHDIRYLCGLLDKKFEPSLTS